MNRLGRTLKPSEVNPNEYAAIYFTGGHGVLWDFPENKALQTISRKIYENGPRRSQAHQRTKPRVRRSRGGPPDRSAEANHVVREALRLEYRPLRPCDQDLYDAWRAITMERSKEP